MHQNISIFGKDASEIASNLKLLMSGDYIVKKINIIFTYKSIEGHPKIIIEFDI